MISAALVSAFAFLAALGCMFYAYTRGKRKQRAVWGWMAVPCLFHAGVYAWIAFVDPSLAERVFPVRLSAIIENAFLAYLTILLSLTARHHE